MNYFITWHKVPGKNRIRLYAKFFHSKVLTYPIFLFIKDIDVSYLFFH